MWGPGLAESDAVTFFLYSEFHGSQRTKHFEIFDFSRADSNTFPLLYITVGKVIIRKRILMPQNLTKKTIKKPQKIAKKAPKKP